MRRARHYFPILLLFAGLGLANSALYYVIARSELQWGIEEAMKGRAICLAGFYQPPGTDEREAARLRSALARISQEAGGLDVVRYEETAAGWAPVFLADQPNIPTPGMPGSAVQEQLQTAFTVAQLISRPEEASDIMVAYAGRPDAGGRIKVVFAVAAEEKLLREGTHRILAQSGWFLLASLASGLLMAELLARISRRALAKLEAEAASLEVEDRRLSWEPSRITEVNDLTNTLKTIASILRENVKQTWRRFFQAELLPRQEEIAADCQAFCDTLSLAPDAPLQVMVRRVNRGSPDDFWGVRVMGSEWRIVAGRLAPPEAALSPLERIVRANAARDYFLGACLEARGEDPWGRLGKVFPLVVGEHVVFTWAEGGRAEIHRHAADGIGAGAASRTITVAGRGALGTLQEPSLDQARIHLQTFPLQPLAAAIAMLEASLQTRDNGILVLFHFEPPSP